MASNFVKKNAIYDSCAHIKITKPDYKVDEKIAKDIATNFRTLPTFEKSLFENVYMKHYSLKRNERLKCCWDAYVQNIESRVFAPFNFPDVKDLHFHNHTIKYLPSEAKYKFGNRKKLKPGPGVDYGGQMPIPQEFLMRRSGDVKESDVENKITKTQQKNNTTKAKKNVLKKK